MRRIRTAVLAVGVLLCFSAMPVHAQSPGGQTQRSGIWSSCNSAGSSGTEICGDQTEATGVVKNIINLFLYAIGILSVIMIVFSGFKYVNSRGDAESIKSAKNTLQYAVVGLIVALLAFTIVNFVIDAFDSSANVASDCTELQSGGVDAC